MRSALVLRLGLLQKYLTWWRTMSLRLRVSRSMLQVEISPDELCRSTLPSKLYVHAVPCTDETVLAVATSICHFLAASSHHMY